MKNWLNIIGEVVTRAAKAAGLPALPDGRGAFDGDSWIWAWYEADAEEQKNASVRETLVRVRPDISEAGFEIDVSAIAWLLGKQWIADKRTYYTSYIEFKTLNAKKVDLVKQLEENLHSAHQGARDIAKSLPRMQKRRNSLQTEMRAEGIIER
jgi:hypothetical protein